MKVAIDQLKCVGAGVCVLLVPDVFDQRDEDGKVVLLSQQPTADREDDLRQAAMQCPAQAIELLD